MHANELTVTQEFTKIEYDPEIDEGIFLLDIPEGATIETLNGDDMTPQEVTIEDAKEALGAFYMATETEGLELSKITVLKGFEERPEFSFDYTQDSIPAFSVSVFKELSNIKDFGSMPDEEDWTIRGQKGTKMESGNFRLLNWAEDGLQYSVILENPSIEFKEVERYMEEMELVK